MVSFPGRVISADGYQMDSKATEAVTKLKGVIRVTPKLVVEVCKIMGLLVVYHRSIQNFSKIAKSLYDLLNHNKKPEAGHWGAKETPARVTTSTTISFSHTMETKTC